jgi:hypothetical protein
MGVTTYSLFMDRSADALITARRAMLPIWSLGDATEVVAEHRRWTLAVFD